MHVINGQTLDHTIEERLDYAMNDEKTNHGNLVRTFSCDPETAMKEMMLSRKLHEVMMGRSDSSKNDVLLYQIRQSFKPGEVTPELALEIGYRLGMQFTKGQHQFVVATHVDHAHIHNHIVFNAVTLDHNRKFRNFYGSSKVIREISDNLCREQGLSVVEKPNDDRRNDHYGKWLGSRRPVRWKDRLRLAIDMGIAQKPIDFDAFRALLAELDVEYRDGRTPSIRLAGQTRFTSLCLLGEGYTEPELRSVINGEKAYVPKAGMLLAKGAGRPNLVLDIQKKLQEGKGAGYERWAKVYNLKQMAKSLSYLMENRLPDWAAIEKHIPTLEREYATSVMSLSQLDRTLELKRRELRHLQRQVEPHRQGYCDSPLSVVDHSDPNAMTGHHSSTAQEEVLIVEARFRQRVGELKEEIHHLVANREELLQVRAVRKQRIQECRFVHKNISLFMQAQNQHHSQYTHAPSM